MRVGDLIKLQYVSTLFMMYMLHSLHVCSCLDGQLDWLLLGSSRIHEPGR